MSRYIGADKTLAYISRLLGGLPLALLNECEKNGIDIVRCKECRHKYQEPWHNGVRVVGECEIWHNATLDDDFCSYGEREGE